jgi:SAM-dependent methyltransferase
MTDEMLELARRNAAAAGVENVEFLKGYIEEMPLADETVDVVISNCVINLSGEPAVTREAARVLRAGGRFAVSDVIADEDMDERTRGDMAAWTGCIAGALTEAEFRGALEAAGFAQIEIRETHRVDEHAAAATIRRASRSPRDRSSPPTRPQTVYRHWEQEQWNTSAIDLAADRRYGRALSLIGTRPLSTGRCRR